MHGLFRDLTGQRFGRLVIVKSAGFRMTPNGTRRYLWEAKCDCGTVKIVSGPNLATKPQRGRTSSCGCLRLERVASKQPFDVEIRRYKKHHIRACDRGNGKRGREFKLSLDQFKKLVIADCSYCGAEPDIKMHCGGGMRNSIDRIDSSKGYVLSNCVTACHACNFMKRNMSELEFLDQVRRIIRFRN